MHHAQNVIQIVPVDRQARMAFAFHDVDDVVERRGDVDRHDICARHHDVVDPELAELEQVDQHGALGGAQPVFGFLELVEQIRRYAAGGITKLVAIPMVADERELMEQTRLLADEVVPAATASRAA